MVHRHFMKPRHVGRQFGGAKKHTSKQFNYKKNYSNCLKNFSNRKRNIATAERIIATAKRNIATAERIIATAKRNVATAERKTERPTAVSRNGEARDLSEIGKVFN